MSIRRLLFAGLLLLSACTIALPRPTPGPPQPGPTLSLAPTLPSPSTTTPAQPTPTITPVPLPPGVISASNADRVDQWVQWGKGDLRQVVWAPDGGQFALVTSLGVYLYDALSMVEERFFAASSADYSAAFSPDWEIMAWAEGTSLRLLSLPDGILMHTVETLQGPVTGGLFSPDGSRYASLVRAPGIEDYSIFVELWNTTDWSLQRTWNIGAVPTAIFTPDSETLASWDAFRMPGIQRWQVRDGQPMATLDEIQPVALAYSPDGETLATGELDGIVRLRNVENGEALLELEGHTSSVTLVIFSPDGARLVSASEDGTARVWQVTDGNLLHTLEIEGGWNAAAAFSPDGSLLALNSGEALHFWRISDGSLLHTLEGFSEGLRTLAVSPDSMLAAALDEDSSRESTRLRLWRLPEGEPVYSSPGFPALCLAFSPDGDRLALGMWDGIIRLLSVPAGGVEGIPEPAGTLAGHSAQVQSLAFSPDGSRLASASLQEVHLWRFPEESLQQRIPVAAGWVYHIAFSPAGDHLASFSADGLVRLWQAADGALLETFQSEREGWDGRLAFSPDGENIILAVQDRVMLWNVPGGEMLRTIEVNGEKHVNSLAFSLDGSVLAVGLSNGDIQLWSGTDGSWLHTLPGHTSRVSDLAFSPDGRQLVSISDDGTLRVWGLPEER